jgi:hypothetical protein
MSMDPFRKFKAAFYMALYADSSNKSQNIFFITTSSSPIVGKE